RPNGDAGSSSDFGNESQGPASSTVSGRNGGEGAAYRGRTAVEERESDEPTVARKTAQTLSVLPLSKIKIVIGKWTHDAAHRG
ncbi:MAG: hypothetical protein ABJX82_10235, partial [Paracoccaceae bacterium]